MQATSPEALDFLLTRRSHPARTLSLPVPDREALMPLLTAAARTPDHGKLVPWRFIVLNRAALARLSAAVPDCDAAADLDEKAIEKAQQQFDESHLAVAVIEVQRPSPKIPAVEQSYSAGAACLGLLNAALAAGWGANWLTGWPSHDRSFVQEALGLDPAERVVGFVHIGTATAAPSDRPRPDVEAVTTWADDA